MKKLLSIFLFVYFGLMLICLNSNAMCNNIWLAMSNLSSALKADLIEETNQINEANNNFPEYSLDEFNVVDVEIKPNELWLVYYHATWLKNYGSKITKETLLLNQYVRVEDDCQVSIID